MRRIIINGVEFPYHISECGYIENKYGRERKSYIRKGRRVVTLCNCGKYTTHFLHRLLAIAFISNDSNLPMVRHLNDIPLDNRLSNLKWGDCDSNYEDAKRNGKLLYGVDRAHSKLTDEDVVEIYINNESKTTTELSNIFNVSKGTISKIQNDKMWIHITNGLIPLWRPYKNGKGMYEY